MKNTKSKKLAPPEKAVFKKKNPLVKASSLLKKTVSKPPIKKLIPPELTESNERTEWRKEKREYWSSRFRKILAEIAVKPKAKKSSFF
jgi:hypothetical protein